VFFRNPDSDVTAVVLTTGEATTQDAINSVRGQTLPVRDIVIIRDIRPFHKALNQGVERVATKFFVQVDADMVLDPHCIAKLREAMRPNVGIAVGHLRDALITEVVGIKLFRTDCFAIAQFRDSISPDTDFVDEIARSGWRTVYVGKGQGLRRWTTLGQHRPDYSPAYTYRKYQFEGQRYRYRNSLGGLRWHVARLEQSQHPSAFVAQVALARGFFRDTNLDCLGRIQSDEEFTRLEAFLHCDEANPIDESVSSHMGQLSARDRFQMCFRAGNTMYEANDRATFRSWMRMLDAQNPLSTNWMSKLALCQGLLATVSDQNSIEADFALLSAFIAAADREHFNDLPSPTSITDPDDWLNDVTSYASGIGLRRFVLAPTVCAEFATEERGGVKSYDRTANEVVCTADVRGRLRIKLPFCLFGHIVCTEPENLTGLFWCIDLLKAGYLFVHVPTIFGPHRIFLPLWFWHNIVARYGWRLLRRGPKYSGAFAEMAKTREPLFQPETGRVLMVTADLARGGSERQMLATVSELLKRGYDARMLAFTRFDPGVPSFEKELLQLGITIEFASELAALDRSNLQTLRGAFYPSGPTALPLWLGERIASVAAAIERHRPSVLHCWLDGPGIFGALAACSLGVPRIIIQLGSMAAVVRRNAEKAELLRQAYRELMHNPTILLLNNSEAGARDYEEWLGLRQGTIEVLYNGFPPNSVRSPDSAETASLRVSLGLPSEATVVGTLMRFAWEKDPDLWLDTAAEISKLRPDVRFLIGGYGILEPDMKRRIEALQLNGRVVLAGPITDPGLVYSAMDVILLTSAVEGLPNVMIEAQAAGRPVIATDVGGTREALIPGRTGHIVRPRSAVHLAKAVIAALDDMRWRKQVRIEGPDFVSRRFGLERMVNETLEYYGWRKKVSEPVPIALN